MTLGVYRERLICDHDTADERGLLLNRQVVDRRPADADAGRDAPLGSSRSLCVGSLFGGRLLATTDRVSVRAPQPAATTQESAVATEPPHSLGLFALRCED